jgi:hypothetical protein
MYHVTTSLDWLLATRSSYVGNLSELLHVFCVSSVFVCMLSCFCLHLFFLWCFVSAFVLFVPVSVTWPCFAAICYFVVVVTFFV